MDKTLILQLRRAVPLDSQLQVIRRHTAAVICDVDTVNAPTTQCDHDAARTRIQGIFNEFFERGCRALNDLAGRN
ncbi:hypothetical protein AA106555_0369 [Neokomagataea thailandica NBRC 106555]|uniref:Transposase n=1 Tax=Neokomagataea thailandica NBRC 106555 TaxID=1223520 RepID=A0ABQ0QMY4_9PROT|nr:hypothetical protein AA106555_0369 [Neokomagataea thailandica NBRC 106555]